jgi:hypothetical protein
MGKPTGPRTASGKARSSQNAAKHWIESGRILPEEKKEAVTLRSGFAEDFKPQGSIENEVIDDLTFNRLIKRRIDAAFTREFSKAAIEKTISREESDERSATQYWLRAARAGVRYWPEREQGERLRPDLCVTALEALKRRIGNEGPQPENLAALLRIFGNQPTEHAALAMYELIPIAEKQSGFDQKAEATADKGLKESVLKTLQTEIDRQTDREERVNGIYEIESASDVQEPPRPVLETLLRYRAANAREFKDLLNSLERIRRLRGGAA